MTNTQTFRWQRLCLVPLSGDDMFITFKVKPSWTPPLVHTHLGRKFVRTDKCTQGAVRGRYAGGGAQPQFNQFGEFFDWRIDRIQLDPYPIYKEAA